MTLPVTPFVAPSCWSRKMVHTAFACVASLALHGVALGGLAWLYRSSADPSTTRLDVRIASVYLTPAALSVVEPAPSPALAAEAVAEPELPAPVEKIESRLPAPVAQTASPALRDVSPVAQVAVVAATAPVPKALLPERPLPERPLPEAPRPAIASEGGSQSAVMVEWRVQDWLTQYRRYPRAARRSGAEGTVWVRFILDRAGVLQGSEIIESSGHAVLDRAALDLLQRAAPFPALPSDLAMDEIELVLPIEYDLTRAARG